MADLRIWQKAFIESHLASENPTNRAQAVCLAFKYEYTLTRIELLTGLSRGQLTEIILSQCDPRSPA